MKPVFLRDIPKGAAIVIVALVLLASVVMGREDPAPSSASSPPRRQEAAPPAARGDITLDIDRLHRPKKEGVVPELFGIPSPAKTVQPAPAAQVKAAPPVPSAPPLPFTYIGRMVEEGRTVLFVARGAEALPVSEGDTVGDAYKLEALSDTSATFVYLPMGTRQTLALPAP